MGNRSQVLAGGEGRGIARLRAGMQTEMWFAK
jgi:hypothetical protein